MLELSVYYEMFRLKHLTHSPFSALSEAGPVPGACSGSQKRQVQEQCSCPQASALSAGTSALSTLPGPKSNLTRFTRDFPCVTSRISSKSPPFRCGSSYALCLNWGINTNLSFLNEMTSYCKNFFSNSL